MQPACRWIQAKDGAYLHWHYSCIATVKPAGARFALVIHWCDREHHAVVASRAKGIRFVERWVSAQKGLPRSRGGKR